MILGKDLWTPDHQTYTSLLDIIWHYYGVGPPKTASIPLRRLSSRFLSVSVGMCVHSAKRPLVRSGSDVEIEEFTSNLHS